MPWHRRRGTYKNHMTLLAVVFGGVLFVIVIFIIFQDPLWSLLSLARYGVPSSS